MLELGSAASRLGPWGLGPQGWGLAVGVVGCGRWCGVLWISLTVVGRSVATLLHWNLRLILRVLDEPRREVGEHSPATLLTPFF